MKTGIEDKVIAMYAHGMSQRDISATDYKEFTRNLKKIYGALLIKTAQNEFEKYKEKWRNYTGGVKVWKENFAHVEQLFDYGSNVRK